MLPLTMFVAALALVGCATGEPDPQPVATVDPQAQLRAWAGEVCASADVLETTVASVVTSIEIDPTAGLDQLPQILQQVQESLGRVESGIDELQLVVDRAPDSSIEARDFAGEVNTLVTASRSPGEEAIAGLQAATEANNIFSAGVAVAAAATAARSAQSDARAAVTLMEEMRSTTSGPLGEAFTSAPECATPGP